MAETQGDVVASVGTQFGDRRFGSAGGMGATRPPCRGPRGEAGLEGPMSRG